MPFIFIESLPPSKPQDKTEILENISRDFATTSGIDLKHITVTWAYYPDGHFVVGGEAANSQPGDRLSIIVRYLAPDFGDPAAIAQRLEIIASIVAKAASVSQDNVFVYYQPAISGAVFDNGKIVKW